MQLADKIALLIFYSGLIVFFFLAVSGKVNKALFFLIPLFPLQNFIEKFHQFPFGKDFVDILLIGMIIGWAVTSANKNKAMFIKTPVNKLLFFMVVFSYFALWKGSFFLGLPAPLSPSDLRVQFWKNYMMFPLLFFLVVNNIETKKDIRILTFLMAFSILISGYYTFKQIGWSSGIISRAKLHGTFVWLGPNEVAAFFASYCFVLWGIFIHYKQKLSRLFILGVFILSIYCVLFLFSRGAYLSVLIGFLFVAITKQKKLIIPLILVLMFWQAVLPAEVVERINQTETEEHVLDSSSQKRLDMWEHGMNMFKENFLFGAGLNVFSYMGYELGDTHNLYVKILAEQGLIGIFIILMIFWMAISQGWILYLKSDDLYLKGLGFGFVCMVISLLVSNFFGDRWTYLQICAFFWVFLGLVVRANLIVEQEKQVNNGERLEQVNNIGIA